MLNELDTVVLTTDVPEHHLQKGDVGIIVHSYTNSDGYEVEFVTLGGETIAVLTLSSTQIRVADKRAIPHVRMVA
ncbi:MAG: DUF4926 domain-containing protein [Ignavibacteriae bacterium]|nr:DUF4926 domain-containing protein [Ignavibacteriota bacterium]